MKTTQIHMVRHGEVFNPRKILYGRLPRFALSAGGREQARSVARRLRSRPIQAVFTSPMLRTRQTAGEIAAYHNGLKPSHSKFLNEICNPFEGRPGAEIDDRHGDVYTGAAACFEQPADVVQRVRQFIARVRRRHAAQQVVAVTHGDVITFMVLWAKGFSLTPINKARLHKTGYPAAYPALASITTLIYRSNDPEEKPEVRYISI